MTPQTAAALRAQSDVFDHPEHPFTQWMREFEKATFGIVKTIGHQTAALNAWNAALAAVLTQEGADHPTMRNGVLGIHKERKPVAWRVQTGTSIFLYFDEKDARDFADAAAKDGLFVLTEPLWTHPPAPAEPRAAEGAGTGEDAPPRGMKGRNWYAEYRVAQEHAEQIDDLCVANARALFRALHPGEPYDEIEREQSHDITCEAVNHILQTTAAAAVPAGGDAEWYLVRTFGYMTPEQWSTWEPVHADMIRVYKSMPDEQRKRYQWKPLYTAPAPRGGVTEAMVEAALDAYYDGYPWREQDEDHTEKTFKDDMRAALEAALSTPPAAQAQDAGPMVGHSDAVTDAVVMCALSTYTSSIGGSAKSLSDPSQSAATATRSKAMRAALESALRDTASREPNAMHWRQAMKDEYNCNNHGCDVVEQRARALAAKEAAHALKK